MRLYNQRMEQGPAKQTAEPLAQSTENVSSCILGEEQGAVGKCRVTFEKLRSQHLLLLMCVSRPSTFTCLKKPGWPKNLQF